MRSSASSASGSVSDKLRSTKDSLSQKPSACPGLVGSAQSATRSLRQRTSGTGQGGIDQFRRAKDEFTTLMEEQPLLLGAVGIAIGATIAALVPTTRRERELMGSASDELADRASELASQKYEELRETASQTVDEFTRSLKEGRTSGSEAGGQQSQAGSSGSSYGRTSGHRVRPGRQSCRAHRRVRAPRLKDKIGESTGRSSGQGGSGSSAAGSSATLSTGSTATGSTPSGSGSGGSVSGSGLSGVGRKRFAPPGLVAAFGRCRARSPVEVRPVRPSTGSCSVRPARKPGSTSTRSY